MKDQDSYRASSRAMTVRLAAVSLVTAMLMLMGCSGNQDTTGGGTGIVVNTAAQIAQSSAATYSSNVNGLITGATLASWIDDWPVNRPAGITGKLVILQTGGAGCTAYSGGTCVDAAHTVGDPTGPTSNGGIGFAGMEFVAHDDKNIFTYDVGSSDWVMSRSDGVMTTVSMVLDGPTMDAFLKTYNIDPTRDMIVFAMGQPGYFQNMLIGRGWYLFRYWGVDASHLAVLDGGIDNVLDASGGYATFDPTTGAHNGGGYFSPTASTPPDSGTVSVKSIQVDNTALQASLQEMLAVAKGTYTPPGGAFIWDARSPNEYNGNPDSTTGQTGCKILPGSSSTLPVGTGCKAAFEGHMHGAMDLNFSNLLYANDWPTSGVTSSSSYYSTFSNANSYTGVTGDLNGDGAVNGGDASYGYLGKTDLQALITDPAGTTETPPNGVTVAAIGYKPGEVIYTHCRTTYRAMITGIAAGVILGYPVKFFDAAWVEWGTLGNTLNMTGAFNVPADSPWRTDVATDALQYNPPADVEPPWPINYYATSANAIINADKAYKTGTTSSGGSSGGGSPPSNPCGG
jgi:3-mercaptopyruvate sulfurtransferase SseA